MGPDKSGAQEQGMVEMEGAERSAGHSHQSLSASSSQGDSRWAQLEGTAVLHWAELTFLQAQHISDSLLTHWPLGHTYKYANIMRVSVLKIVVDIMYSEI